MIKSLMAIVLAFAITSANAKETITIEYGFGPGDTIVTSIRALVDEANRLQDKYTFLFDIKPGAGSSIAANYVARNPKDTILFISSAFFVRPNFFPESSHNISDFREIMPLCQTPMSVASVRYKTWREVPADTALNMGTSGLGVVSHMTATKIVDKYPKTAVIPFKSTTEALLATIGGQLDITVGFIGEQELWSDKEPRVHILGITGTRTINGHAPLSEQGFGKILGEANQVHQFMVSVDTPEEKFREWRAIMIRAARADAVREGYKIDYCKPESEMSDSEIQPFFERQRALWKTLSTGVKIN